MLVAYYKEFVHFFFPDMAKDIDRDRGYQFLDKELKQIVKDSEIGARLADLLTSLHRLTGEEEWVLNHVEIQGQKQNPLPKRMYVCNYRAFDRFDRKVASIAILADSNESWRPDHFSYELWASKAGLWFPTVKLLDYQDRWDDLEDSLWLEIQEMERETKMEYISSVQRIGREQGVSSVLERQLSKKYKINRDAIFPIFEGLTADQIEELAEFFVDAQSLDEIRARADELRKSGEKTSSD